MENTSKKFVNAEAKARYEENQKVLEKLAGKLFAAGLTVRASDNTWLVGQNQQRWWMNFDTAKRYDDQYKPSFTYTGHFSIQTHFGRAQTHTAPWTDAKLDKIVAKAVEHEAKISADVETAKKGYEENKAGQAVFEAIQVASGAKYFNKQVELPSLTIDQFKKLLPALVKAGIVILKSEAE